MKQTTLNFHLKAKKDILWLECQIHKGIREKTELQRNFLLVIARYTPLYYISTFTLLFPSCSLQLWAFHQRIYFIVISTKISGSSQLSVLVENFERRWWFYHYPLIHVRVMWSLKNGFLIPFIHLSWYHGMFWPEYKLARHLASGSTSADRGSAPADTL